VVDDSRTNLNVIGKRLTHFGYLTALADNGAEAHDLIAARAMELGEARAELADIRADRQRLILSIQALHDEVERLRA